MKNKTTLLIASNNAHKIAEIKQILNGCFYKIISLKEADINCAPEETGETFYENALIKANAVAGSARGCAVLADDTGLCVNALNGEPGVYSARYGGDHDSAKNRKKLLEDLQQKSDRSAYFQTAVVLRYPDGTLFAADGRVDGRILEAETGDNGFGYDCIFFCDELGKSFGNASEAEKNAVSHRSRALRNLLNKLKDN